MKKLYSSCKAVILAALFSLMPVISSASVIYVNITAAGTNDGTSWTNAFTSLSNAIVTATDGDEIWVARGVYKPTVLIDMNSSGGIDPREATFALPDNVALYGGFSGTELSIDDRNWETNLTILSGDIDNNDVNGDANFIAEDTDDIIGNNAYHVVYTNNVDAGTIVDGFIITAGSADIASPVDINDPNLDGGGWYNQLSAPSFASSPGIANTVFKGNYSASEGGAFYSLPGPTGAQMLSLIAHCEFSGNKSGNAGGALHLGSYFAGDYHPVITNSRFTSNEAYRRGGAIYFVGDHAQIDSTWFSNNKVTAVSEDMSTLPGSGGAINMVSSNATFTSCIFQGNMSTGNPTGFSEGGGGGAIHTSSNEPQTLILGAAMPVFSGCGFYNNTASGNGSAWGGAVVHLNDGGRLQPTYVNCVFTNNQAQNEGGAIGNFTRVISNPEGYSPLLEPIFTNCTFTENHAGTRGGAIYNDGYLNMGTEVLHSRIENSILWNNSATVDGAEIFNNSGDILIAWSIIEGSGGSGGGWDVGLGTDGGNNSDEDPDFVNETDPDGADNQPATADDGLRLSVSSPAANAGNNAASGLTGITIDYLGNARISGGTVDMGAYERFDIVLPDIVLSWLTDWYYNNPPCYNCPPNWSFTIFERMFRATQFSWTDKAQFVKKTGFAEITGVIQSKTLPKTEFAVYIKLVKPKSWSEWNAEGGIWFAVTPQAYKAAKKEHKNWTYWELSDESYFEASGNLTGKIHLKQLHQNKKTGFQTGKGANGFDSDNGVGGYFIYSGNLKFNGKNRQYYGLGTMNVDEVPCEENCIPVETKTFARNEVYYESEEEGLQGVSALSVYPVPAYDYLILDAHKLKSGHYTMKILDMSGREKFRRYFHTDEGNPEISLTDFQSGIYILSLESENEQPVVRRIVVNR